MTSYLQRRSIDYREAVAGGEEPLSKPSEAGKPILQCGHHVRQPNKTTPFIKIQAILGTVGRLLLNEDGWLSAKSVYYIGTFLSPLLASIIHEHHPHPHPHPALRRRRFQRDGILHHYTSHREGRITAPL
jgi:hypothetical protein